jgi:hypothetical protein
MAMPLEGNSEVLEWRNEFKIRGLSHPELEARDHKGHSCECGCEECYCRSSQSLDYQL